MTNISGTSIPNDAAPAAAPIVYVCITCKRAGDPDTDPRPGAILATAAARRPTVRTSASGKSDASPIAHADPARRCVATAHGLTYSAASIRRAAKRLSRVRGFWRALPTAFCLGADGRNRSSAASSPAFPPSISKDKTNERVARSRSLHHRHRLSRRRQDDTDPPCARQCAGPAPGRDRQRVRRRRDRW